MHNHRNAGSSAQWLRRALFVIALALTACGGGGGGNNSSSGGTGGSTGGTTSSGGGTNGTNAPTQPANTPSSASNIVTVSVAHGVNGTWNIPTVSVTLCVPNSGTCQTIDNVQVDTESSGLRIMSSALSSPLTAALPQNTAASGGTLAECMNFADGYMWGTVRTADVTIGGEKASAIPVQVVGDLAASSTPSACQGLGSPRMTPDDIGANGILGISVAPTDCDANCVTSVPTASDANSGYYGCPGGTNCTGTTITVAQTVPNPVAHFAQDNNGVSLQLPTVPDTGAPTATGSLVFGIGTQTNNAMNATQKLATNGFGDVIGTFNGTQMTAFLDSGSNALFFNDSTLPACTGSGDWPFFYCPSTTQPRSATLTGADRASTISVNFKVANAQTLYNTGNLAFNNLGGAFGSTSDLDLGLPFFFGKTVYYGYGAKPFVAF